MKAWLSGTSLRKKDPELGPSFPEYEAVMFTTPADVPVYSTEQEPPERVHVVELKEPDVLFDCHVKEPVTDPEPLTDASQVTGEPAVMGSGEQDTDVVVTRVGRYWKVVVAVMTVPVSDGLHVAFST